MHELKTCRFCGESNYDYNHAAVRSAWVQYGTRHHAHLKCAIEKLGAAFLERLPRHKLEQLPALEIHALGMEPDLRRLLSALAPAPGSTLVTYSSDCAACLRGRTHTLAEHEAILRRNREASRA